MDSIFNIYYPKDHKIHILADKMAMTSYEKEYYCSLIKKCGSQRVGYITTRQSKRKIALLYVCELLLYSEGVQLLLVGQDHHFPTDIVALLGDGAKVYKQSFRYISSITYDTNVIRFSNIADYKNGYSLRGYRFNKEIFNNQPLVNQPYNGAQQISIKDLEYHIKYELTPIEEDILLNMVINKKSFSNGCGVSLFLGLLRYYLYDSNTPNIQVYMKTNGENGLDLEGYLRNNFPHDGFTVNHNVKNNTSSYDIKMRDKIKNVDDCSVLPYKLDDSNTNLVLIAGEPTEEDLGSIQRYLKNKSNAKIFTLNKTGIDNLPTEVYLHQYS